MGHATQCLPFAAQTCGFGRPAAQVMTSRNSGTRQLLTSYSGRRGDKFAVTGLLLSLAAGGCWGIGADASEQMNCRC